MEYVGCSDTPSENVGHRVTNRHVFIRLYLLVGSFYWGLGLYIGPTISAYTMNVEEENVFIVWHWLIKMIIGLVWQFTLYKVKIMCECYKVTADTCIHQQHINGAYGLLTPDHLILFLVSHANQSFIVTECNLRKARAVLYLEPFGYKDFTVT